MLFIGCVLEKEMTSLNTLEEEGETHLFTIDFYWVLEDSRFLATWEKYKKM